MMAHQEIKSSTSVGRKVLFVFIACVVALVLAWLISRVAFSEMMETVEQVTTPNRELELVGKISQDIMRLDQLQRSQAFIEHDDDYSSFADESAKIIASLDTLKTFYLLDTLQVDRLDSIQLLLQQRDKLFNAYIKVRDSVVDQAAFTSQLDSLSIAINEPSGDSTIITTSQTRRTTSYDDDDDDQPTATAPARNNRGFFSRLFGSRRQQEEQINEERRTIEEELRVHVDTIRTVANDSTIARIDSAMRIFQARQVAQREQFISREMELTLAGNALISNMLTILSSVEQEAFYRMQMNNAEAKAVVSESIFRIGVIILVFFVISAVMVYFILADIRRNAAYRVALENAKEEAEYHAAAKQRFLANMSHELRTPLQSIIGFSEQLKDEQKPDPEKLEAIYQSSEHLLQIVNEILDYSRITSGKISIQEHPFVLTDLLDNVVTMMKPQANKKGLELSLHTRILTDETLLGDDFRIRQVLFNLLSNAIKFTETGSVELNVSTTKYGEKIVLSIMVKDTGRGIPEKDLDRIFNDFEQSENANSGVYFGSGLGLSIVKAICESMGGSIQVSSKKGIGSTFTANLSVKAYDANTITAAQPANDSTGKTFEGTLWLVDDDKLILRLCRNILENHGIAYRAFNSPKEILSAQWDDSVKTILMDIRMPEMNGTELNHELRKQIPEPVTIYAFTAQALPEEQEEILAQGFDGILLKPFREADLLRLLGISPSRPKSLSEIPKLDTAALSKLTMDDHEQVTKILQLYMQDTQADIETIRQASIAEDHDTVELLLHRMAGRTAQIGADKLAFKLRKLEIDTRNDGKPDQHELNNALNEIESFVAQVNIYTLAAQESEL